MAVKRATDALVQLKVQFHRFNLAASFISFFFDFSYLFSNNFKVSNRVIDLIYFSVFNGMKANDMGRETIIFPTKGSSGIGFAAWAICYYNHFPLEDLLVMLMSIFNNTLLQEHQRLHLKKAVWLKLALQLQDWLMGWY